MIEGQATNEDFEPSLVNEDLKSEVGDPNIDLYNALKNMPTPSQSSSTDIDPASPIIITHNMNYENYPNQQSAEILFLKEVLEKFYFTASGIYNMDETGITAVQKSSKLVQIGAKEA